MSHVGEHEALEKKLEEMVEAAEKQEGGHEALEMTLEELVETTGKHKRGDGGAPREAPSSSLLSKF